MAVDRQSSGSEPDGFGGGRNDPLEVIVEELKLIREVGLDALALDGLVKTTGVSRVAGLAVAEIEKGALTSLAVAQAIVNAITLICRGLGEGKEAYLARTLFRLTDQTKNVSTAQARRQAASVRGVRGEQWRRRWEPLVLKLVAQELLRGGWRVQAPKIASNDAAFRGLSDPEDPYLSELIDITVHFGNGRVPTKVIESRVIRALRDGLSEFVLYSFYASDSRPGVIDVEVWDGGHIEGDSQPAAHGAFATTIKFPYPLMRNEIHRLWFVKRVKSNYDCLPYYSVSSALFVEALALKLQFSHDALPERIWRFQRLPPFAVPGSYYSDARVTLDHRGHLREQFADLRPGFCYGVGWNWGNNG